jgi:hypothetical protein
MFGDPKAMAKDILGGSDDKPEEAAGDEGLDAAAEDLISAVKAGDAAGVKSALRAAFDLLESEPHEEAGE